MERMSSRLRDKVVVISAAAAGIGRATALLFAREGATVWATDIDAAGLSSLEDVPGISTLVLDVTNASEIAVLRERAGPVDVLFNCAGIVASGALLDCPVVDWNASFDINVTGQYLMIQAFLPGMLKQRSGSIINMSSVASSMAGVKNRCAYSASKAAVIGLTKSVAVDYVDQGVRCNAICPGTVLTPSLTMRIRAQPDHENALAAFIARQPMGRLGLPEEIAEAALYFASDMSSFVTGTTLTLDGGMTL